MWGFSLGNYFLSSSQVLPLRCTSSSGLEGGSWNPGFIRWFHDWKLEWKPSFVRLHGSTILSIMEDILVLAEC